MRKSPPDAMHAAIRLRTTVSRLSRHLRAQGSADVPGSAKLSVLGQLYRLGSLTPTQLALEERVKLQSLTRLLAELESEGYVTRRAHDDDMRQSILSLTPTGARLLTREVQRREASLAAALETQLNAGERARVLGACDLIDRLAEAMNAEAHEHALARGQTRRTAAGKIGLA